MADPGGFFVAVQLPDGTQKDGPYQSREEAAAAARRKYDGRTWWILQQTPPADASP